MAQTSRFATATILALAATLAAPFEGYVDHPYRDPVGVLTVCRGHTGNIHPGHYTRAECDALFAQDLDKASQGVRKCVHVPLTDRQSAALADFVFNEGQGQLCRSTLAKLANAGRPASEWCPRLNRYKYAGGQILPGLVRRRAAEVAWCVS